MAKRATDTKAELFRTSVTLEKNHKLALELIAPGNASQALRYLIRYALERGALEPFHRGGQVAQQQPVDVDKFAGWDDDD